MSSPDRMEMHARAIANLVQAMDRMEQAQQEQERRFQALQEKTQEILARAREWKEREKAYEEWRQQFWAHLRKLESGGSPECSATRPESPRLDPAS